MKNYRYHRPNECIRRNQAQGGSKPDPPSFFFPGVCSGGYLFYSGGPTPTTPPRQFYPGLSVCLSAEEVSVTVLVVLMLYIFAYFLR